MELLIALFFIIIVCIGLGIWLLTEPSRVDDGAGTLYHTSKKAVPAARATKVRFADTVSERLFNKQDGKMSEPSVIPINDINLHPK